MGSGAQILLPFGLLRDGLQDSAIEASLSSKFTELAFDPHPIGAVPHIDMYLSCDFRLAAGSGLPAWSESLKWTRRN